MLLGVCQYYHSFVLTLTGQNRSAANYQSTHWLIAPQFSWLQCPGRLIFSRTWQIVSSFGYFWLWWHFGHGQLGSDSFYWVGKWNYLSIARCWKSVRPKVIALCTGYVCLLPEVAQTYRNTQVSMLSIYTNTRSKGKRNCGRNFTDSFFSHLASSQILFPCCYKQGKN